MDPDCWSVQPTTIMASATSTPAASAGRSSRSASRRSAAASSSSPTCLSRTQEKDELRNLNDRLANYIQRVQELESERSSMLIQLEEKDESKSREMGNVRRLYEEELADVRKSLDSLAGERARLQIDYGNLCDEYRKLQARQVIATHDRAGFEEAVKPDSPQKLAYLMQSCMSFDAHTCRTHTEKCLKLLHIRLLFG